MRYITCTNCAVSPDACQRRQEVRNAIKGQHITSIKFICPERKPLFYPGQRISFSWSLWENDVGDYGQPSETELLFRGTVLREVKTKFVVQVDHGEDVYGEGIDASQLFTKNDQLIVKVRPADMAPIDEPSKRVCQTCYWVEGVAEDRCPSFGDFVPVGCKVSSVSSAQREPA